MGEDQIISHGMTQKTLMSGTQDDIKQRGSQLRGNRVLVYSKKHDEEQFHLSMHPKFPHYKHIGE